MVVGARLAGGVREAGGGGGGGGVEGGEGGEGGGGRGEVGCDTRDRAGGSFITRLVS